MMTVPAVLGKNGVEKVITVDMTEEEKGMFNNSTNAVTKTCNEVDEMLRTL